MSGAPAVIELRRSGQRFLTRAAGVQSRHSFAFGAHHDPDNVRYGPLLVHNEDVIQPGAGYPIHAHRDLEILTWVLSGSMVHEDENGDAHLVTAGQLQRISAGTGIRHTERNAEPAHDTPPSAAPPSTAPPSAVPPPALRPVHLVQMWLDPGQYGGEPSYQRVDASEHLRSGLLVPIAGGDAARRPVAGQLRTPRVGLSVARLEPGDVVVVPAAAMIHLFLARGHVVIQGDGETRGEGLLRSCRLGAGDALRLRQHSNLGVIAQQSSELLVLELG